LKNGPHLPSYYQNQVAYFFGTLYRKAVIENTTLQISLRFVTVVDAWVLDPRFPRLLAIFLPLILIFTTVSCYVSVTTKMIMSLNLLLWILRI